MCFDIWLKADCCRTNHYVLFYKYYMNKKGLFYIKLFSSGKKNLVEKLVLINIMIVKFLVIRLSLFTVFSMTIHLKYTLRCFAFSECFLRDTENWSISRRYFITSIAGTFKSRRMVYLDMKTMCWALFQVQRTALAGVAQWVECWPVN